MRQDVLQSQYDNMSAGPKENVAAAAKYPAFREELVSTLVYTLRHHAAGRLQNVRTLSPAAGSDSAVQQNVGGVLRSAAGEHARSQLCDWLSATKICLQARAASPFPFAAPAPLLQPCIHASCLLPCHCVSTRAAATACIRLTLIECCMLSQFEACRGSSSCWCAAHKPHRWAAQVEQLSVNQAVRTTQHWKRYFQDDVL